MKKFMRIFIISLRSVIFNILFLLWMTLIAIIAYFYSLFSTRQKIYDTAFMGGTGVAFLLKYIVNLKYKIIGLKNLPLNGQYIIACKHQSAWETILLNNIFPYPTVIYKKELHKIPFFGRALKKSENIAVERTKGKKSIIALIAGGKKNIALHRPIFIFPEGARTNVGEKPNYRYGVVALYQNLQVPVVPVALNSGCFWARRAFLKYPGEIIVKILPTIEANLDEDVFKHKLEKSIEESVNKICHIT